MVSGLLVAKIVPAGTHWLVLDESNPHAMIVQHMESGVTYTAVPWKTMPCSGNKVWLFYALHGCPDGKKGEQGQPGSDA